MAYRGGFLANLITPFLPQDDDELGLVAEQPRRPPIDYRGTSGPIIAPQNDNGPILPDYQPKAAERIDSSPLPAAKKRGGILGGIGRYLGSKEGILAIGTALRAGGGEDEAFDDQARLMGRWDTRRKEDEAAADLKLKNQAFQEGWVVDPKTGKRRFSNDAYLSAADRLGVKGDRAAMLKEAKDLRDQVTYMSGKRGGVYAFDEEGHQIEGGGVEGDPETKQVTLPDGRTVIYRRAGSGGAAAAAAPEAGPGGGAPAAPPPAPAGGVPDVPMRTAGADTPRPDQMANRAAIAGIESQGSGGYQARGPVLTKGAYAGDRAYGKYQVMGKNIGPWTEEALGFAMTPEEFLANPKAQDAVFDFKFGQSVQKYGSPEEAASVWFTGRPLAQGANARDVLGTTGAEYVQRFKTNRAAAAGIGGPRVDVAAAAAPGAGADAAARAPATDLAPPQIPGWEVDFISPAAGKDRPLTPEEYAALRAGGGIVRTAEGGYDQVFDPNKGGKGGRGDPAVARQMREGQMNNVIGVIDKTLGQMGEFGESGISGETGLIGSQMAKIPGTTAYNVARNLETIKANLGFDRLQQMREESPTGGALGQVAVQELVALQASLASLDQGQSLEQLQANLASVKEHYQNWARVMQMADAAEGGGAPAGGGWGGPAGGGGAPPASKLKEGVQTTFGNGQVWTLQGGQPKRLK